MVIGITASRRHSAVAKNKETLTWRTRRSKDEQKNNATRPGAQRIFYREGLRKIGY